GHGAALGGGSWGGTAGAGAAFVQGMGTASALLGVTSALKERNPEVRVVGLEPAGSAAISGGPSGSFAMQGWAGMIPPLWDPELGDDGWTIEDGQALERAGRPGEGGGGLGGTSSAGHLGGAFRLARGSP